jgi:ABC-2 type transport system permease protein
MKLQEIFRFEFLYQASRVRTWIYAAILFAVAYLNVRGNSIDEAREGLAYVNSPYVIAAATVICNLLWVLMASAVAGSAAARDVQTRMHPLVYTAPISKADYLGGRFLAAFAINAMILLAVPVAILLAPLVPPVDAALLGPFQPMAFVTTYLVMVLPTAFAVGALQFSIAALTRRWVASYVASVFLFVAVSIGAGAIANVWQMPSLGKVLDPIGFITVIGLLSKAWGPVEKNTLLVGLQPEMLMKAVLWIAIGLAMLALTHFTFRFGDVTMKPSKRAARRRDAQYAQQH